LPMALLRDLVTSQCANPACAVPLRILRDGRLFQFEVKPKISAENWATSASAKISRKISHFWLCGQCSSRLTLAFDQLKGVVVKPLCSA